MPNVMSEREFLISLAINRFNLQFNRTFQISDFDVKSIQPAYKCSRGYEVYSVRFDDFLRLRVYFNFGNGTSLGPYRLETDITHAVGVLGDEVFVSFGEIDSDFKNLDIFKFQDSDIDVTRYQILIAENNEAILTEDGEYILLEDGV